MKKNMGTPGVSRSSSKKILPVFSANMNSNECRTATCEAAKSRMRSRLFSLNTNLLSMGYAIFFAGEGRNRVLM